MSETPEQPPIRTRRLPPPVPIRLSRISLCDYQAFPGPDVTTISLLKDGKGKGLSLLLYGENGSGKSSLGRAIRDMLESSAGAATDLDESGHVFSDPPSPDRRVTLEFDDNRASPAPPMEWRPGSDAHRQHELFQAMSKSRGWMDYRTLWKALEFGVRRDYADVFESLVETLLMDCEIPAWNGRTFGELWRDIARIARNERPTKAPGRFRNLDWLKNNIELFNTRLAAFLPDLEARANDLLAQFVPWTVITVRQERPTTYNSSSRTNKFSRGTIALRVTYRGRPLARLDGFLNEARITAMALSLFLAALTLSTPPRMQTAQGAILYPRLLVLDDILISLDMAHRRPLLEILNSHFEGWQVLLLTHDRTWYELAKLNLPDSRWKAVEMFAIPCGDYEQPLIKDDAGHLDRARHFLNQGEVKAAAVHIRTQFELLLKTACRELHLKVVYVDDPKKWEANHFWDTLKGHWAQRTDLAALKADVSHSLSWVMNPHSHSRPVDHIRSEIHRAVQTVAHLEAEILRGIAAKKQDSAGKAADAAKKAAHQRDAALAALPPAPDFNR